MKKLLLLTLGAAVAFTSCKSEDPGMTVDPVASEISFSTKINDLTRASGNNFENGDAISVFAKDGSDYYAQNIKYVYGNDMFTSSSAISYANEAQSLSFSAIYPYSDMAADSFEFEVAADQSAAADFAASDLMTANVAATKSESPELAFFHRLSQVEVNIISSDVATDDAEVVVSAKTVAECGVEANTFIGTGSASDVVAAANGTNSFKAIVAPQEVAAGASFITIEVGGESYTWKPSGDVELGSGKKYVCQVSLAQGSVVFEGKIEDWGNGGYIDGSVEGGEEPEPETGDFSAELVSVSTSDIVLDIDKGEYDGNYYVGLTGAANYPGSAEDLAAALIDAEINEYGTDLSVVDDIWVFYEGGEVSLDAGWNIYADSEYYVVAFGISGSGEILTNVAEVHVTTESVAVSGSIDVTIDSVGEESIVLSTKPSAEVGNYIYGIVEESYFETELAGDVAGTASAISSMFAQYVAYGYFDFAVADGQYIMSGDMTFDVTNFWAVEKNTTYKVFVFGVDASGAVNTEVAVEECTTPEGEPIVPDDGSLSMSLVSADASEIVVAVEVEGSVHSYYVAPYPTADYEADFGGDPATMAAAFMDSELNYYGTDLSVIDNVWVFAGSNDHITTENAWNITADTDYTVFAFGMNEEGGVTTNVATVECFTGDNGGGGEDPDPDTDDFTASISVDNVSAGSADVYWTVSDESQEYVYALFSNDGLDDFSDSELMDAIVGMFAEQGSLEDHILVGSNGGTFTLDTSVSEYSMMIFAINASHSAPASDLFRKDFSTAGGSTGGEEPSGDASDWFGTWTLTSASSEVDGGALSVDVIMKAGEYGAAVDVYGWDISANRWIVGMPASLNAAGDLVFAADSYMTTIEGQGDLHFQAKGFVEGSYQDYYFITGDYDAMTVSMGSDKESASTEAYVGTITGDVPFTISAMVMTLLDGEDIYTFYADETLGFDQSECLVGPYTLTKKSDDTTLPSASPAARAMALANINVVNAAISKSVTAMSRENLAIGSASKLVIAKSNARDIIKLSAPAKSSASFAKAVLNSVSAKRVMVK